MKNKKQLIAEVSEKLKIKENEKQRWNKQELLRKK